MPGERRRRDKFRPVPDCPIGYARVSADAQDLTAQRDGLAPWASPPERVYVDHGLTGTHGDRPGLREALAACRPGTPSWSPSSTGSPVAARCPRHRRRPHPRQVKLSLGGSVHDPTDPVGRLLFNVLAMVAEFESD